MDILINKWFLIVEITYILTVFFEYLSTITAIRNADSYARQVGNELTSDVIKKGIKFGFIMEGLVGAILSGGLVAFIIAEKGNFTSFEYVVFYFGGLVISLFIRNYIYSWITNAYSDRQVKRMKNAQAKIIKEAQKDVANGTLSSEQLEHLMDLTSGKARDSQWRK